MPLLIKKISDDEITVTKELAANLGFDELSLLIKIMLLLDENFDCSSENIGKFFCKGKNGVNKSLKILKDKGYLVRRPQREGNRIKDWEYIFSNHILTDIEKREAKTVHIKPEDIQFEDIQIEDIHNRDVAENSEFFDEKSHLDSSIKTKFVEEEKETCLDSSNSILNKYIEYEEMLINEHDLYELEKAMTAAIKGEIDASKSNVIKYAKRLYDPVSKTFKTKYGEHINSLYKFIVNSFTYKTEQDKLKNATQKPNKPIPQMYKEDSNDTSKQPVANLTGEDIFGEINKEETA